MMTDSEAAIRERLRCHDQDHLLRFWPRLSEDERRGLIAQIESIDFPLMDRLIDGWVLHKSLPKPFDRIETVPLITRAQCNGPEGQEATEAGEEALRSGRVGLFLVAGGQGTRLGFPGPKGAYPIGPVSQRPLFAFHAEKIHNLQGRYGCRLPWYIMLSETNEAETRAFFDANGYFGLQQADVRFCRQRMVPCVTPEGRFMLDDPGHIAMNPNGHGGSIPAMVECGILDDARERGVDTLSYFQVDNWAARVADPLFIGFHVSRHAEMSSKSQRRNDPNEAVGVHCLCDGEYRVIEYTEFETYPQMCKTADSGEIVYPAGNPAIHIVAVDFVKRVYDRYEEFPWHLAFKKIPYVDDQGDLVTPAHENGYKFETFIFDALRFVNHPPVVLEIERPGEYTPIKVYDGTNSVLRAWDVMAEYWARWFEAAGCRVPRDGNGKVSVRIEVSPQFARSEEEFLRKTRGWSWPTGGDLAIDPNGGWIASRK
ncbi:MAG TPA: UTP--glucose-1-phosphate uridylyltransferase [Candidatus Hydrogenedentes bacterium]|nr:UTP--glucose-1-phosphate uridylyltransferase [Candidatus Hydrogenedentota bacterium]HPG69515.1 UTP--glucose-1-phosphate uridylyltransferase [Candidatus Hydrogenedentota bacterium]